ncbi:MAG: hypothetical protein OQL09_05660 [Gammaproteobacteria bacterium]|nr:hypothetical protein [Gammaproteobacteria bacterium]
MKPLPLLILSLVILNSACTSTPYNRGLTPSISGVLNINSEPKADITLYLSRDSKDTSCSKAVKSTTTNEQGQFHFAAIKEQMTYTPLMTYYLNEWVICAEIYGTKQMIYSDNSYAQGSVTSSLNLICDSHSKFSKQIRCHNQSARKN